MFYIFYGKEKKQTLIYASYFIYNNNSMVIIKKESKIGESLSIYHIDSR